MRKKLFSDVQFSENLLDLAIDLCSRVCAWTDKEKNLHVVDAIKQVKESPVASLFTELEKQKLVSISFIKRALVEGLFKIPEVELRKQGYVV